MRGVIQGGFDLVLHLSLQTFQLQPDHTAGLLYQPVEAAGLTNLDVTTPVVEDLQEPVAHTEGAPGAFQTQSILPANLC